MSEYAADATANEQTITAPGGTYGAGVTSRFRIPSRDTVSALFMRHGTPWLIAIAVCVVASVVAGAVWDSRFYIVALIVIFLLLPPAAAFLYFIHGLRPATVLNSVDHTVGITGENIVVTVWPPKVRKEGSRVFDPVAERERLRGLSMDNSPRTVRFPLSSVRPYTVGLSSVTLPLQDGRESLGFLILPLSAFPNPGAMQDFLQALSISSLTR